LLIHENECKPRSIGQLRPSNDFALDDLSEADPAKKFARLLCSIRTEVRKESTAFASVPKSEPEASATEEDRR
jgi:hypothetical protein